MKFAAGLDSEPNAWTNLAALVGHAETFAKFQAMLPTNEAVYHAATKAGPINAGFDQRWVRSTLGSINAGFEEHLRANGVN